MHLRPHTYRHNIKIERKNTIVQNYNTEKYTDKAKKRESKDHGEKDSETTKEREGGRTYK